MYSPKIREDLIPRVYRAAKEAKLHMTTWVNQAVEKSLPDAANNHKPTERTIAMKRVEPDQTNRLETKDTFIVAKGDAGYRVCSPLTPAKQYVVTGIPNDPQCTCEEFMHPDCPPGWLCEHIQAVLHSGLTGATRTEASSPAPSPTETGAHGSIEPPSHNGKNGNGKAPRGRNGKGVVMLLKRSVSPDGRIDSLSVEFTCPVGSVTTGGIKELAQVILGLQGEITAGFLKTNGKGRANGKNGSQPHGNNGNGHRPDNTVPGQLLSVGSMNTRRGPSLFLNVLVNGKVLRMFGSEEQLAEAVSNAGYPNVAAYIVDGYTLNLPCRVVTKPNGKYVNVERLYPAQAEEPARV